MASGISTVVLAGNLTADPELRSERLLTFTVAVNRRAKNADGEWGDSAHFFDVKVLGNRASSLSGILEKGRAVTVLGDLVQERWEKDGQKRSALRVLANEVVLHGAGRSSQEQAPADSSGEDQGLPF